MEDKYKSYTVAQLAADDSFILWILRGENDQFWSQWLYANPGKTKTITEASLLIKSLAADSNTLGDSSKKELWNTIQSSVRKVHEPGIRKTTSILPWSIAAAAAFALLIWVFSTQKVEKVMAEAGEKKEIILPESSSVTINAGSKLVYHNANFKDDRDIRLEGEAFFKVNPGTTFTVITDQGNVTVLGTSFNVISRPGRFEVTCYTGKVKVEKSPTQYAEIVAGEKIISGKDIFEKRFISITYGPSWINGKFTFEDQPLSVVIEELERQYNINVSLQPGIKDMRYTGLFEAGALENALHLITWPLHLKYEIRKDAVNIYK